MMHDATAVENSATATYTTATLRGLFRYFLWLGTAGFGGPVVLMERMRLERRNVRDIREKAFGSGSAGGLPRVPQHVAPFI